MKECCLKMQKASLKEKEEKSIFIMNVNVPYLLF